MSLFAIGDTHLSFGVEKPMDVFHGWNDYEKRLEENWRSVVGEDDTVLIIGAGLDIDVAGSLTGTIVGQILLLITGLLYLMVGIKMFKTDK